VRLAAVIDWQEIERTFGAHFASTTGRPALPPRLVAGLLYLQHAYDCSDEAAVNTWVENPYWQHFTGETWFQTEAPIDPSSLTRWRKRIGEEGVETMLMVTIDAAAQIGLLRAASVDRVIVDTTVMPKAIAHPTDSRLLEKSRQHLVKLAGEHGIAPAPELQPRGPEAGRADRTLCPREAVPADEESVAHAAHPRGSGVHARHDAADRADRTGIRIGRARSCAGRSASSRRRRKTRTSSTPSTRPRSNASPRARPERRTSSA
jgi:hypothetical protein